MKTALFMSIFLAIIFILDIFNFQIVFIRKKCIDNIQYIISGSNITVAYDLNGKVKTCNGD